MPRAHNSGRRWTQTAKNTLRSRARVGATTASIARALNRTKAAVRAQASRMKVSLKPRD